MTARKAPPTEAETAEICDRYRRGESLATIGAALHRASATIRAVLEEQRVPVRKPGPNPGTTTWSDQRRADRRRLLHEQNPKNPFNKLAI